MWRLILGGVLCACSMYVGYGIKRYYIERAKFFRGLLALIDRLVEEISFLKPPLHKILGEFGGGGELGKIIVRYMGIVASKESMTEQSMAAVVASLYLNKREKELLSSMLLSLGTLDTATQLANLNSYKSRFGVVAAECEGKLKTVGALSFKLGVLCGILIMILVA